MKLWELDWTEGKQYRDIYVCFKGTIWTVQKGELVDRHGLKIHETYSSEQLVNLEFEPEIAIDWSKVSVHTKLLVSNDGTTWHKRYFDKYENAKAYAFKDGCTSWSSGGKSHPWIYVQLLEGEPCWI